MKPAQENMRDPAAPAGPPVRLRLLGAFSLSTEGHGEIAISSKKNRALLACLALAPGHKATRERLCGLLWGDRDEEQARSSLRQSIAVLRRELGPVEDLVLARNDDLLNLKPETVSVDVSELRRLVSSDNLDDLRQGAGLWRGELLADISLREAGFGDWLDGERRKLADLAATLFERLSIAESGKAAVAAARQLLSLDPLREASHRNLMSALAAAGEKALAFQQFDSCVQLLKSEFGLEPDAETQALRTAIAAGSAMVASPVAAKQPQPAQAAVSGELTVAIMPFVFHGGDDLRYLEDGIAEDIVTELSRHRTLRVIASASAATQRGELDPQQAGRRLGASHIVTGSFRPAGVKFRISAQLVEVVSGASLWSERYDVSRDDVQVSLDRLVTSIATVIERRIGSVAAEQVSRRPIASWTAYDHYLKGRDLSLRYRDTEAVPFLDKAVELDPSFAPAFAWRAIAYVGVDFSGSGRETLQRAEESARRALELDDTDARAHNAMGYVRLWQRRHDLAASCYERALALNPSDVLSSYDKANLLTYTGKPADALALLDRVRVLDPFPPTFVSEMRARALFHLGRLEEALLEMENIPPHHLWLHWWRASCLANLGRLPEARAEIAHVLDVKPDATVAYVQTFQVFSPPSLAASLIDGLRAAGLPD